MLYRVDYALRVLILGFIVGVTVGPRLTPSRARSICQTYFTTVVSLSSLRILLYACSITAAGGLGFQLLAGILSDGLGLLFGFGAGLAVRRRDFHELFEPGALPEAFCLMLTFSFALSGVAKALSLSAMTDFFVRSGYTPGFLKFIVMVEIFGALGLFIRGIRIGSIVGLLIDMFGAIVTHVHNGDPLNDSTGAISMLIRPFTTGILLMLQCSKEGPHVRRLQLILGRAFAIVACFLSATCGAMIMRHLR